jgi:uncharacterized protein (TIGR02996 family)
MSEGAALLRAIIDDPDDPDRRLVYADWLEEQADSAGPLHAEFIRLEHRLHLLHEDDPQRRALDDRRYDLWNEHSDAWFPDLSELVDCVDETWCGFPEAVTVSMRDFIRNAEAIYSLAPVRRVLFMDHGRKNLSALCACQHLRRVRRVAFGDWSDAAAMTYAGARKLAASPYVDNLEHLDFFESQIGAAGVEALAASPHLRKLRHLELSDNVIGDRGAVAIALARHWDRIEILDLRSCGVSILGLRRLASAQNLRGLRELRLQNNFLGPDAGAVIAGSGWLRLCSLDLGDTRLDAAAVASLAASAVLAPLSELRLCYNNLGLAGLEALLASPDLRNLEKLDLADVGLDAEAARRLAQRWPFERMRDLRLDSNQIGDEGAAALARCPGLASLSKLSACEVGITDQGVKELAESPHLLALRTLWMRDDSLTEGAIDSLVASPYLSREANVSAASRRITDRAEEKLKARFRG